MKRPESGEIGEQVLLRKLWGEPGLGDSKDLRGDVFIVR
jgi:hypothetical protein